MTDQGLGIDERGLSKAFLPFFTTKAEHNGLGLTMANRFVNMHGGSLTIKSTVAVGTEVKILLPLGVDRENGCR